MVVALVLAVAVGAPAIGVVTTPRSRVVVSSTVARVGHTIRDGDTIEVGPGGWCEIVMRDDVRLALSAATRVEMRPGAMTLQSGRVTLRVPATGGVGFEVRAPDGAIVVWPGATAVVEHRRRGGTSLSVGRGRARASNEIVHAGQTFELSRAAVHGPRSGGRAMLELASNEARLGLRDPLGLQSFLLSWVQQAKATDLDARGVCELVRLDHEVAGMNNAPCGVSVEEALRPPPFFEEEVPPKGPNVRVEVEFGSD